MLQSVLLRAVLLLAMSLTINATSWAADVVLSHQGRLLDASDTPITGTRDILYRIYDAQTGGIELWSEMHASVSVSNGLFTVSLGSTTPLSSDLFHGGGGGGGGALFERWLEIVVSGTVITPRTRLSATPFSAVSSGVSGDIETSPGVMKIHCTACSALDGITLSSDADSDDLSMVRLNGLPPGTPYIGRVAVSSSSSSSSIALGDLDADGAMDMHCGPDSTVFDMGSANSGTVVSSYRAKAGKTGATKRMIYSSGGSTSSIGDDCDDSGAEMRVLNTASSSNQGWSLRCKPDSIVNEERLSDGRADVVVYKATTGKTGKAKQSLFMAPGGGTTEVDEDCGSTGAALRMKVDGLMGPRMSTNLTVGKQSSRILLGADLDGDGLVENSCASTSDSTHSGVSVSSRFGSGPRQTTSMDGTFSHAHVRCDSDSDDDGVADNSVVSDASSSGSSLRVISLNGLPPGEPVIGTLSMISTASSATLEIGDLDGDGLYSVMSTADSVIKELTVTDHGPGGVTLMKAKEKANRTKCSSNLRCQSPSVSHEMDASCDVTSSQIAVSSDSPGGPGASAKSASVTVSATPGGSACRAIATKGNGQTLRSSIGATELADAQMLLEADTDGDGTAETTISQTCDESSSRQVMAGTTSVAGSGGASHLTMEAAPTGSSLSLDKGDVVVAMESKDNSGSYTGEFKITVTGIKSPGLKVALNSDGIGYLSNKLGVGVVAPTHHIDVAGGAYCDGTNWVNASDRNSKENFQKVDGEELLEKISDLEITKWNYKGDKDAEHIGPTAQDFKKTFGVGADDKSISTIDPSGIALAAIKELYKKFSEEMKQKDTQIEQLQKEMKKLRQELQQKKN